MLRAARSLNGLSQQELADGASNFRPCLTAWEGIERQRSQRWRACAASMLTRNRRIWLASGIGLVRAGTLTLRSGKPAAFDAAGAWMPTLTRFPLNGVGSDPRAKRKHMWRREFISLVGCAERAWRLAARAQRPERIRRVGVLTALAGEAGWTEGQNFRFEF